MQLINGMVELTKTAHQDALTAQMQGQFKNYQAKLGGYLNAAAR